MKKLVMQHHRYLLKLLAWSDNNKIKVFYTTNNDTSLILTRYIYFECG